MTRRRRKRRLARKVLLPPGSLVYTGEHREDFVIRWMHYDADHVREGETTDPEKVHSLIQAPGVTWVDVVGLHRVDVVERLGTMLGIHPLVLEDILNVNQRPKIEDHGTYVFLVLRMYHYDETAQEVTSEQVSFLLMDNILFSFQEKRWDVFDAVRERIRQARGTIRKQTAEYLLYALVDAVVDYAFVVLEKLEEESERLEERILSNPQPVVVNNLHQMRKNLIEIRKSVWPLREVLATLSREQIPRMEKVRIYFQDVYDHTLRVMDAVESLRDTVAGLLEVYFSSVSARTNEIMRVLTLIATLFMPLTFIAGIYGMNFQYMPELEWKYGYPAVLVLMALVAGGMLLYFRRKGWL